VPAKERNCLTANLPDPGKMVDALEGKRAAMTETKVELMSTGHVVAEHARDSMTYDSLASFIGETLVLGARTFEG
jgi:hypothetical protein